MSALFSIRNLRCGYQPERTVLAVEALDLPRHQLVFIVGVSGGGKSTLLETLGMMNNTIQPGSSVNFHPGEGLPATDLADLWGAQAGQLDLFRKQHFSFLFQKTNLIPNFSCGENMLLPALFKGKGEEEARTQVQGYMARLGLPADTFDKRISNVSGGQRQRLAFIRAMVADFTVLFGDEPTGNLDPNTAREVMTALREHLRAHEKTGIVVSHDIELANAFADKIVPITLEGEGTTQRGTILAGNILRRQPDGSWRDAHYTYESVVPHLQKLMA
ncbi:MAG: ABC transporter ATP-binding protein [Bacteroidota bacterium]